jgi:hypothetical protein
LRSGAVATSVAEDASKGGLKFLILGVLADAPNTGFRQRPPAELGWQARAVVSFQQRTTAECYASFPGEVKSSCPMYLAVPVPDDVAAIFASDPTTGNRRMPEPTDGRMGDDNVDFDENLRFLAARRGLESK